MRYPVNKCPPWDTGLWLPLGPRNHPALHQKSEDSELPFPLSSSPGLTNSLLRAGPQASGDPAGSCVQLARWRSGKPATRQVFALSQQLPNPGVTQLPSRSLAQQRRSQGKGIRPHCQPTAQPEAARSFPLCRPQRRERKRPNHSGRKACDPCVHQKKVSGTVFPLSLL